MVEVRACVYFCVIFLCFQLAAGKPFYGEFLCDLFCDGDDDATDEDYGDWCSSCGSSEPKATTTPAPTTTTTVAGDVPPFNLMIQPGNGMNVTFLSGGNNSWLFNFIPWMAPATSSTTAAPASATTTAASATTAAGATTAAAGATTAAPA